MRAHRSFFPHSLQCTLNFLTQVSNSLFKYHCLAEIPVGKTEVPNVKTTAKGICRATSHAEVCKGLVKESLIEWQVRLQDNTN